MSVMATGDINLTIISTVKGQSNFVNGPHVIPPAASLLRFLSHRSRTLTTHTAAAACT